jgi:glycosyltransferase involved in cell wall biosynthesis
MKRAKRSMLNPIEVRVIHNGIDLDVFQPPENRRFAREQLGLPPDAIVLLAVVQKWNRFKDYDTVEKALLHLSERPERSGCKILFVALGGNENLEETIGNIPVKKISYLSDPSEVARYYQAADVFLHAAHSDNFPTTILESLACGTPVIATAVGGIPEQISHGETGFLVPQEHAHAMAEQIALLIQKPHLRARMGTQAAKTARSCFGLKRMVDDYLAWYQEIVER